MVLYGLFVLWPLLQIGWLALQRWDGYGPQEFVGLRNVADLWNDPSFRVALEHSAAWETAAAVLLTVIGLLLALLARESLHGPTFLAVAFFPALLPPIAVAAIWSLVYTPISGLLNTVLRDLSLGGLTRDWLGNPHLAFPALFAAWAWASMGAGALVFWTALQSLGREWTELAKVEGAGPVWRFVHVLLPSLRHSLITVVLVNVALSGQVFDLVFATTGGGPGTATMILPLDAYSRAFGGRAGQGAAAACFQIGIGVILAAVTVLLSRRGDAGMHGGGNSQVRRGLIQTGSSGLLALVVTLLLLPLVWLALVAWGHAGTALAGAPDVLTSFSSAWNAGMGEALATSLLLATSASILTVLLAVPCAFALSVLLPPGVSRITVATLLVIGIFQPTAVLIVPLFYLLGNLGLLDNAVGVVLPEIGRGIPFAVLIVWAALSGLPVDLWDAAAVDGTLPRQTLARIAIPLLWPSMLVAATWSFITSWNEYLIPTLVSGDSSITTVPTLLKSFIGHYNTEFAPLAAGILLAMLPVLAAYLVARPIAMRALLRGRGMP